MIFTDLADAVILLRKVSSLLTNLNGIRPILRLYSSVSTSDFDLFFRMMSKLPEMERKFILISDFLVRFRKSIVRSVFVAYRSSAQIESEYLAKTCGFLSLDGFHSFAQSSGIMLAFTSDDRAMVDLKKSVLT